MNYIRKKNILMIHGWGGNSFSDWELNGWNEFLDSINLNPIYVDILGHGKSNHPLDPSKYNDLAGDILNQISEIDTPYAIGFSLGSKLLLEIAFRESNRFEKIIISGLGNNVFQSEKLADEVANLLDKTDGFTSKKIVKDLADYAVSNGNNPLSLSASLRRKPNPILTPEKIKKIHSNILIICGDKDEVAYPFNNLKENLLQSKSYIIRNINHLDLPGDNELKAMVKIFLTDSEFNISKGGLHELY